MQKYHLDWKTKLLFWLLGDSLSPSNFNLQRIRSGAQANPLGRILFKQIAIADVQNRSILGRQGEIPVRIYRPQAGRLPVIVFFHGGGWVLGGLESHDPLCRRLAVENNALVVSVDYRLAPENPYPAAVEDAYDATSWVADHLKDLNADPNALIVMGDSAGGNLAAVVSLMARDLKGPQIAFQVLIYPATDIEGTYPSKELYDDTPVLSRASMIYYRDQYIPQNSDLKDPHLSPLLADDLSHLPPALILTGEYDPLRDEGKAYADRLHEHGNDVTYVNYEGMPHGFLSFGRLGSKSSAAFSQIQQTLKQCLPVPVNS